MAVQEQANADFVLSFTPGNFYFTVRALKRDAEDHLTVIFNRKAYVLHLAASEKPFYSVTFFQGGNTRAAARPVVPERLLSLLDKAKAYPLFQKDHPDALAGVLHAAPNATNYYDNFRVVARDVWRFEEEDTLIFRIDLENTSDRTIYYKPQDLAIRLEDRIYTRGPQPKPDNTPVASQATQAKSYSFEDARTAHALPPGAKHRLELPSFAAPGASAWACCGRFQSVAVLLRENERRADQRPAESLRRGAP